MKTTLVEGSVKISANNSSKILVPGQQLQIEKGRFNLVDKVNIENVIAWKNGAFNFSNNDVPTVLRQLARWYDIEVIYTGQIPSNKISGEMGRNLKLSDVLYGLKAFGLRAELKGKQLYVSAR